MKRQHLVIIFVFFSGLIILPYIAAWKMSGSEYVFGGMLANPIDGQSYLAKMRLGFDGHYLFHLLYSPQNGGEQPLNVGVGGPLFWLVIDLHFSSGAFCVGSFIIFYALCPGSTKRGKTLSNLGFIIIDLWFWNGLADSGVQP
ncbi:MAG: hypothetical protein LWX83_19000 [Anaerolineae bacterium]|nr:hypothetical protein [Anaerolineae bacterium]